MANAFATRTAMQREHVEQPEHGENDADEQRLTPCLAISGAQRLEKSAISNLFTTCKFAWLTTELARDLVRTFLRSHYTRDV